MNMFKTFERRVGDVFGASPRGHVAPFSFRRLAKRAARELEAETYVIDGINTAPALITVLVSAEDDALMRPIYAQLTEELSALIEAEAASKDYVFVGKPLSRFMVDQSLKPGRFAVFANNVDARSLEQLRAEERAFLAGEDVLGGAASVSAHAASHSAGAHASGAISTPVSTKSAQDHINLDDSAAGLSVLPPEYDQPLSPEDDLVVGVAAIPDIAFEQPEQENAGIADESGLDALPKPRRSCNRTVLGPTHPSLVLDVHAVPHVITGGHGPFEPNLQRLDTEPLARCAGNGKAILAVGAPRPFLPSDVLDMRADVDR